MRGFILGCFAIGALFETVAFALVVLTGGDTTAAIVYGLAALAFIALFLLAWKHVVAR